MTVKTKAKTSSFKKDNEVTLKVANTEIKIGSTYEVIGKLDRSAPDGFQKNNTTKGIIENEKSKLYYRQRLYDRQGTETQSRKPFRYF